MVDFLAVTMAGDSGRGAEELREQARWEGCNRKHGLDQGREDMQRNKEPYRADLSRDGRCNGKVRYPR